VDRTRSPEQKEIRSSVGKKGSKPLLQGWDDDECAGIFSELECVHVEEEPCAALDLRVSYRDEPRKP
jgi:hypothetical protein